MWTRNQAPIPRGRWALDNRRVRSPHHSDAHYERIRQGRGGALHRRHLLRASWSWDRTTTAKIASLDAASSAGRVRGSNPLAESESESSWHRANHEGGSKDRNGP